MDELEFKNIPLYEEYLNFLAIRNSLAHVQKQTGQQKRNDDKFLAAIEFPYLGGIPKDRTRFVDEKMDAVFETIEELIIIGLVSKFEKIIFERIGNASGEISKIVKEKYTSKPFLDFSEDFVKTLKDIDSLSVIKAIISPKLPKNLSEDFAIVIEHRNILAHGKRFAGKLSKSAKHSSMSFEEIAHILDDVLNYV